MVNCNSGCACYVFCILLHKLCAKFGSYGGFYFAPVVKMINLVRGHVGITNLPVWVTSEGMSKIVELVPATSHNQNLIAGLYLFLFVLVCNCLNLYQCGNVVGAPANTNRSKAPLQTQSNQLNDFVIPTPWLAVLSMPRKNLGDAPCVSNWFIIEFGLTT